MGVQALMHMEVHVFMWFALDFIFHAPTNQKEQESLVQQQGSLTSFPLTFTACCFYCFHTAKLKVGGKPQILTFNLFKLNVFKLNVLWRHLGHSKMIRRRKQEKTGVFVTALNGIISILKQYFMLRKLVSDMRPETDQILQHGSY